MLFKQVYCCSLPNKHLLEFFPFLSNNCQKMDNMRTGTEIISQCIIPYLEMPLQGAFLLILNNQFY